MNVPDIGYRSPSFLIIAFGPEKAMSVNTGVIKRLTLLPSSCGFNFTCSDARTRLCAENTLSCTLLHNPVLPNLYCFDLSLTPVQMPHNTSVPSLVLTRLLVFGVCLLEGIHKSVNVGRVAETVLFGYRDQRWSFYR